MIELFAIARLPGPPLPPVHGLGSVVEGALVAVFGSADSGPEIDMSDRLWRFEAVVEALMGTGDVLPVRYGVRVEDEAAVAQMLTDQQETLLAALDRVCGTEGLSLRYAQRSRQGPATGMAGCGGTEYLREKIRAAAARGEIAQRVHVPLARLARDAVGPGPLADLL